MNSSYGFGYAFSGFLLLGSSIRDDDVARIDAAVGGTAAMATITAIPHFTFGIAYIFTGFAVYIGSIPASLIVATPT
ncbi:hypothetical protein [Snodgrassella alvi]|uniref:hypothetical protein n=1 Tax=Snodgrassella alvi TaxID=1196083 RepID=UPI0035156A77